MRAGGVTTLNPDGTWTYLPNPSSRVDKCMFTLDALGQIATLTILQSSGDNAVDQTALALIRKAAPFKSQPHDVDQGAEIVYFGSNSSVIVVREKDDRPENRPPPFAPVRHGRHLGAKKT